MLNFMMRVSKSVAANVTTDEHDQVNLAAVDFGGLLQQVMGAINNDDIQQFSESISRGDGAMGARTTMYQMFGHMNQTQ